MKRCICRSALCLLVLALLAGNPGFAAAETPEEAGKPKKVSQAKQTAETKQTEEPKPPTHTVEKGPFKIQIKLDGVFEGQTMTEVVLRPKTWSDFSVLGAVEHGARVNRGDLLVTLDLEKIDKAIADLRTQQKLADLALKQAQQQLQLLGKSTPLDLQASQRAGRVAKEDSKFYFKVGRPLALKSAHHMLERARQRVEYEEEELRQLEKMYKADDLTEETEEIILKRARNSLEQAKFYLESAKIGHDRALKFELPRRDESVKESAQRCDLQWNKAKVALPLALRKQRLELEKMKIKRARSEEKLKKLLADRAAMIVKAPAAGVVYYGKCTRGKFSSADSKANDLRRGGSLSAGEVFMTIVKSRPMHVRATIPEKQLQYVRAGSKGIVQPTGYPDLKLTAIVDRVAPVPVSSGKFDARITVELDRKAEDLMPGMTCKVKLVPYLKKHAITVPPKCVSTDELDDQKHYVYLLDKDGKPKKQYVTVGKRTDKKVEILKGLSEGDKILLERSKKK